MNNEDEERNEWKVILCQLRDSDLKYREPGSTSKRTNHQAKNSALMFYAGPLSRRPKILGGRVPLFDVPVDPPFR